MAKKQAQTLDKAFLEEVKQQLLERKERIEHELSQFTEENSNGEREATFPDYGNDEGESALEVMDYNTNKPLEMTLEKELRDIEKALERVADGTYGVCKYCDQPINPDRLRARPESSSCVECKKALTEEA